MDELFKKGVEFFNKGYYFEAHDVFEEIWMDARGKSRPFYQGLVQLATGFYHFRMANLKGAQSQLKKGCGKLEAFAPQYQMVSVSKLLRSVSACLEQIEAARTGDGPCVNLDEKIPKIFLVRIEIGRG